MPERPLRRRTDNWFHWSLPRPEETEAGSLPTPLGRYRLHDAQIETHGHPPGPCLRVETRIVVLLVKVYIIRSY